MADPRGDRRRGLERDLPRPERRRSGRGLGSGLDPGFYVIDLDATLVGAHSDKEGAAPNYKHGFGFAPMVAFLDATGEPLAALLRPGNAAAGSAADHVELLDAALAQLPIDPHETRGHRPDRLGRAVPTVSSTPARSVASASSWATDSVPSSPPWCSRSRRTAGVSTISADGTDERDVGRRGRDHRPGRPLGLARGHPNDRAARRAPSRRPAHLHRRRRAPLSSSSSPTTPSPTLPSSKPSIAGRGRCERRIGDAKDTGLANLPSASFALNEAWLTLVLIAGDLLAWMKGLCLEGALAKAEPKRLRYTLLHTAGLLVRSARRTTVAHRRGLAVGRRDRRGVRAITGLDHHPRLTSLQRIGAPHAPAPWTDTPRNVPRSIGHSDQPLTTSPRAHFQDADGRPEPPDGFWAELLKGPG